MVHSTAASNELIKYYVTLGALFTNGLHAGALLFVSLVSARALMTTANKKNEQLIRMFFPIWWPYGRDLMLPLGVVSSLMHFMSFYTTRNWIYLICGSLIFTVIYYTGSYMLEDINTLRKSDTKELIEITKSFCKKHHFRTFCSILAFILALITFNPSIDNNLKHRWWL